MSDLHPSSRNAFSLAFPKDWSITPPKINIVIYIRHTLLKGTYIFFLIEKDKSGLQIGKPHAGKLFGNLGGHPACGYCLWHGEDACLCILSWVCTKGGGGSFRKFFPCLAFIRQVKKVFTREWWTGFRRVVTAGEFPGIYYINFQRGAMLEAELSVMNQGLLFQFLQLQSQKTSLIQTSSDS